MTAAASLLLLTTLATSSPAGPVTASAIAANVQSGGQQTQPDPRPGPTDPPHRLGLGGSMGFGNRGGGGGLRLFANDRLGLDLNVGWFRNTIGSTSSGGSTFVVSPSVLYMLRKPNAQANVDVRPYVGGGVNYSGRTIGDQVRTSLASTTGRQRGLGGQVFGGVEMTFAEAKAVAISAEVAHYEIAASTGFTAGRASGTDFYLMFHFYVN